MNNKEKKCHCEERICKLESMLGDQAKLISSLINRLNFAQRIRQIADKKARHTQKHLSDIKKHLRPSNRELSFKTILTIVIVYTFAFSLGSQLIQKKIGQEINDMNNNISQISRKLTFSSNNIHFKSNLQQNHEKQMQTNRQDEQKGEENIQNQQVNEKKHNTFVTPLPSIVQNSHSFSTQNENNKTVNNQLKRIQVNSQMIKQSEEKPTPQKIYTQKHQTFMFIILILEFFQVINAVYELFLTYEMKFSLSNDNIKDSLQEGQYLLVGQYIQSGTGQYAVLNESGNLVLYSSLVWEKQNQIWSSGCNVAFPQRLQLQKGQLVIRNINNQIVWESQSEWGASPHRLTIEKDNTIAIYDANNIKTWTSPVEQHQ